MALPNIHNFIKQFNITPNELRMHLTTAPHLHEPQIAALSQYKLLIWNKELLQHKMHGATLTRFGIEFQVHWNSLEFPTARSRFVNAFNDSKWKLSFRVPHPDSGLLPVVLISYCPPPKSN